MSSSSDLVKPQNKRLRSLDVFRGTTILLMIFVNNGGGGYSFLNHTAWNGLLIADCLFPWFMFIMGVSIHISMSSATRKEIPKSKQIIHILRRSAILFMLGLTINSMGNSECIYFF